MRRGFSTAPAREVACLWAPRRFINRHHSPDRTFSQEIQDRQNAFQWSSRHIFRPHQHFSYDPSNWSRRLEEKTKRQHRLSLVERVKLTQEHEAERSANTAAMQQAPEGASQQATDSFITKGEADVPAYFFSLEDTTTPSTCRPSEDVARPHSAWKTVPLQELVEELQRLQHLLFSCRYAGNVSLARRARHDEDFRIILLQLFERLRGAVLEETVTIDACAFGWMALLRHVEPLVETIAGAARPAVDAQDAVQRVFDALQQGLLRSMEKGAAVHRGAAAGELPLEALIELLSIAASPFVLRCGDVFQGEVVSLATLAEYADWVSAAAHQRARDVDADEADGAAALREWVAPVHLEAWTTAIKHLHRRGLPVKHLLLGLNSQVRHAVLCVTRTLKGVTDVTVREQVKESLRGSVQSSAPSASQHGGEDAESMPARVRQPKAVVLDATSPPRGVQAAPTECDDVSLVLSAAMAVLQLVSQCDSDTAAIDEESTRRLVTECLQMTAQAPNYDLGGGVVVQWACTLLQTGALMRASVEATAKADSKDLRQGHHIFQWGAEDGMRLSLRFLLLLSRLSFHDVVDRPALGRLVLLLSQWPEPACAAAAEGAEWRRLRGLVMKAALDRLTCEDLAAAAAKVDGVSTWVETLAFGEYGGVVPLELWRAACQQWLPLHRGPVASSLPRSLCPPPAPSSFSGPPVCPPGVAHALLLLCARYIIREEAGRTAATANIHSLHTATRVAESIEILLQDRLGTATTLLQSADSWDAVRGVLPATLHSLVSAMQAVVRRETAQAKVMSF
ncbi:hypothetical protein ABL78_1568 [Leptomonas seymouri]|uniref:Uncharacterized protein n=1 Tax=Leptomonas seymouri TaxID=5684 RepID=A0A0N0P7Y7_LEPSE|nr:hypothetical protein ABL78_1568 [Leptomonas seymouri]|eukprot:KPI89339.1 hypothetical protein ABL78_1568 [Leptomonas seymouri]